MVFHEDGNAENEVQYIGDGTAFYQVNDLPHLDKESILTIFDISEKQRGKWLVKVGEIPEGIDFSDVAEGEQIIKQLDPAIVYNEKILLPLQTQNGILFINSKYLSPLSDVMDALNLFERETKARQVYIVAKVGLMLKAIIFPIEVATTKFVEKLEELARECAFSLEHKEKRERTKTLKVDTETGEII